MPVVGIIGGPTFAGEGADSRASVWMGFNALARAGELLEPFCNKRGEVLGDFRANAQVADAVKNAHKAAHDALTACDNSAARAQLRERVREMNGAFRYMGLDAL